MKQAKALLKITKIIFQKVLDKIVIENYGNSKQVG